MELRDRVVVVSGGGQHLGRAFSLHLASLGAQVVVADIVGAEQVATEITEAGGRALGVSFDLMEPDSVRQLAQHSLAEFGRVDALVNNAGYFRNASRGAFLDISDDEWQRCFDINTRGTWWVIRAFAPHFIERGYGKIVNVSSATAYKGIGGMAHYVASKAAVTGLTRALAVELGEHHICVNTLAPDAVLDEEMLAARPQVLERVLAQRAIKRPMDPSDLVGTVAYLCGPASDFVTGQSLHVNGGTHLS